VVLRRPALRLAQVGIFDATPPTLEIANHYLLQCPRFSGR
jgi:hypothetical protein